MKNNASNNSCRPTTTPDIFDQKVIFQVEQRCRNRERIYIARHVPNDAVAAKKTAAHPVDDLASRRNHRLCNEKVAAGLPPRESKQFSILPGNRAILKRVATTSVPVGCKFDDRGIKWRHDPELRQLLKLGRCYRRTTQADHRPDPRINSRSKLLGSFRASDGSGFR